MVEETSERIERIETTKTVETTETKLRSLGDPSGQQTSTYWDEWFNIVCTDNHNAFEWYVSVEEVARISKLYLTHSDGELRFIHPGSGNSLVPIHLRDEVFLSSHHVVLDISSVALHEMRSVHDSNTSTRRLQTRPAAVEYKIGDVLQTPLPYPMSSFDAWIDKGLLDALFSGEKERGECSVDRKYSDEQKSQTIFHEAHRLLKDPNGNEKGVMMIITMAEEHSLHLITSNWISGHHKLNDRLLWNNILYIHELKPISGKMTPFAFVLQKRKEFGNHESSKTDNDICYSIEFQTLEGRTYNVEITEPTSSSSFETVVKDEVQALLKERCATFRKQIRDNVNKSVENAHMVLGTIDIKPSDDSVNLEQLSQQITGSTWGIDSLTWHKKKVEDNNQLDDDEKENTMSFGDIVPIGFGINKLQMQCVVDSEKLEDLCEAICEYHSGGEACCVQSVDIVWDKTCPVGGLGNLIRPS